MSQLIRTLVVDDSAFVRKVVREMLSRDSMNVLIESASVRSSRSAVWIVATANAPAASATISSPARAQRERLRSNRSATDKAITATKAMCGRTTSIRPRAKASAM